MMRYTPIWWRHPLDMERIDREISFNTLMDTTIWPQPTYDRALGEQSREMYACISVNGVQSYLRKENTFPESARFVVYLYSICLDSMGTQYIAKRTFMIGDNLVAICERIANENNSGSSIGKYVIIGVWYELGEGSTEIDDTIYRDIYDYCTFRIGEETDSSGCLRRAHATVSSKNGDMSISWCVEPEEKYHRWGVCSDIIARLKKHTTVGALERFLISLSEKGIIQAFEYYDTTKHELSRDAFIQHLHYGGVYLSFVLLVNECREENITSPKFIVAARRINSILHTVPNTNECGITMCAASFLAKPFLVVTYEMSEPLLI